MKFVTLSEQGAKTPEEIVQAEEVCLVLAEGGD